MMNSFIIHVRMIKLRRMRMVGHIVELLTEMANACKILVAKPEGRRPLGIHGSR